MAAKRLQHVLVTIPASNYCEKARWGLRLAKIDFTEEKHAPLFHYAGTVPKGGKSVPFLVLPDGKGVLPDSDEILSYCGKALPSLYPNDQVKAKELYYDNKFGPHARRYAYHMLFSMGPIGRAVITDPLQSSALSVMVATSFPLLKTLLIRALNVTPEGAERSWAKIETEFAAVDAILGDAPLGTRYLAGDVFSAADVSFCSHGSLLIGPKESRYVAPYLNPANMPPQFQDRFFQLQRSKAGQFVQYCYENHYPSPDEP
ncbi:hypothetical protein ACHHYP_00905 [Achlya hypogyna]|uniref:GST N-terminal domain-containing protein n=1 Tax=Achlya hypogyna TaxID=1202772 RepID=A0A1V9ZA10_ACHHY|nr:hypothetical protein ACHHYP_00905 [Achlya hypogyna]